MNVIDNSPIGTPKVGKIITEPYEIDQLTDCHLYLLPSNAKSFEGKALEAFNMLIEKISRNQLLNKYKLEVANSELDLTNYPILKKAIETNKCNFMMPLYTPNQLDKQYLITHTEETYLYTHLPLMIYTSERITKNNVVELMLRNAMDDTDSFLNKTKSIWKSEDFAKRVALSQASTGLHPTFGMAVSKTLVKEALGKDAKYTHQKQIELQKEFTSNLHDLKTDSQNVEKTARVKLILGAISNEDILEYLLSLNDEGVNEFAEKMSPLKKAEQSKIKVQVKYVGRIENKKPANGRYRIFFEKGGVSVQVHFGRRSAFLIYLIYLMDVIKSEDVNSIDISKYEDLFCKLFEICYGYDGGKQQFKTLFGKGNSEQELLRHSYGDIVKAVGKVCTYFGESKTPFIVQDAQSHLYILKQNILIDDKLLSL